MAKKRTLLQIKNSNIEPLIEYKIVKQVLAFIHETTGYNYPQLCDKNRKQDLSDTRQVLMYCLYNKLLYSHASIGYLLGERTYGTSINAIRAVERLKDTEPRIRLLTRLVNEFIDINNTERELKKDVFNELLHNSKLPNDVKFSFRNRYNNGK